MKKLVVWVLALMLMFASVSAMAVEEKSTTLTLTLTASYEWTVPAELILEEDEKYLNSQGNRYVYPLNGPTVTAMKRCTSVWWCTKEQGDTAFYKDGVATELKFRFGGSSVGVITKVNNEPATFTVVIVAADLSAYPAGEYTSSVTFVTGIGGIEESMAWRNANK